uniref:HVA22-like protein k n=1 Tax=Rhizophora mucronata TaxID=61149 RepID=A0A2P2JGA5_RHIMU
MGSAYGELVRLSSTHQGEIEYAKTMVLRILGSDGMPKGDSSHAGGHPAIESGTRMISTIPDAESNHDD